jgi:hypothetical protein
MWMDLLFQQLDHRLPDTSPGASADSCLDAMAIEPD